MSDDSVLDFPNESPVFVVPCALAEWLSVLCILLKLEPTVAPIALSLLSEHLSTSSCAPDGTPDATARRHRAQVDAIVCLRRASLIVMCKRRALSFSQSISTYPDLLGAFTARECAEAELRATALPWSASHYAPISFASSVAAAFNARLVSPPPRWAAMGGAHALETVGGNAAAPPLVLRVSTLAAVLYQTLQCVPSGTVILSSLSARAAVLPAASVTAAALVFAVCGVRGVQAAAPKDRENRARALLGASATQFSAYSEGESRTAHVINGIIAFTARKAGLTGKSDIEYCRAVVYKFLRHLAMLC